ncbi:MAG: HAD family hydrolase [Defluviitaleaceae bacterium]|nr:HAD family hydrolase [Defluviitaleaceae bacterium]
MSGLQVKAVCFDYYGTLVDIGRPFEDIRAWFESFLETRKRVGLTKAFHQYFNRRRAVHLSGDNFITGEEMLTDCYSKACAHFRVEPDFMRFSRWIEDTFTSPAPFTDAMKSVCDINRRYPVGLITNADDKLLNTSINRHGFRFDFIMSSEAARCNKPELAIFKSALERLRISPQNVLMVGDSIKEDVLPAQSLGMQALWLNRDGKDCPPGIMSIKSLSEIPGV